MNQYRLVVERVESRDGSEEVGLTSEYGTEGHAVKFSGSIYPKDLELFSRLVEIVKHFQKHGTLPEYNQC